MSQELILKPDPLRYVLFPIPKERLPIWNAYKKHLNCFWTPDEIDFSADKRDWLSLDDKERHFLEMILAFFAGSDGIVLENLLDNFATEIEWPEVRCFYAFQGMIENIHSEVYSLLIDTYVTDNKRKTELFNAITEIPSIKKKADWAQKWMNSEISFNLRLIAFAVVEGVFFSGSFCAIFWLKSRNKMVKALGTSNELIARDEGMHTDFAVLLFSYLQQKPEESVVHGIFRDAVMIETEFVCDSLPYNLQGMNKKLMSTYIKFVADRLLVQLGYSMIYHVENPFPFMENTCLDGKTNFFEKRVSEYKLSNTEFNKKSDRVYSVMDEF